MEGLAAEVVADLDDVTVAPVDGQADVAEYRRAGRAFARASAVVLEVRLPEDIADAAMRTPDTDVSAMGPDWVRFAPRSTEPHVADRARAWLITAWRHAAV